MLPHEFQNIIPPSSPSADILEPHKLTREFHQEVNARHEFSLYCEWYYETAQRHQQELEKMTGDINILGWFRRTFF